MSGHDDELARLLAAVAEEEPPRALRERALAAASSAWPDADAVDPWRRLWESRPLRLAWVAVVVLLAAANLAVRVVGHGRAAGQASSVTATVGAHNGELQAVVALPRLRPEYVSVGGDNGSPATHPGTAGAGARHRGTEGHS